MARVVYVGDQSLRKVAAPVTNFNDVVERETLEILIKELTETMYAYKGLGLAANQIGIDKAVCVIDVSDTKDKPEYFINPRIIRQSDVEPYQEGCLSIPGVQASKERARTVTVEYHTLMGELVNRDLTGLLAVAMQHEIDHLNGKLFIDDFSSMQKMLLMDKHKKYVKRLTRLKF